MATEWSDELIGKLRDLWSQGLSTAEIGRQLAITKNAVVGKAHRLGLPARPSPIRNKGSAAAGAAGQRKSAPRARKGTAAVPQMPQMSLGGAEDVLEGEKSVAGVAPKAKKTASRKAAVLPVSQDASSATKAATSPLKPAAAPTEGAKDERVRRAAAAKEGHKPEGGSAKGEKTSGPASASPQEESVARESAGKTGEGRKAAAASSGSEKKELVKAAGKTSAARAPARPAARKTIRREKASERSTRQGPTCQWPNGDPGTPNFHFCGATPLPGKPYCAEHAAIAYVKLRDRREG